MTDYLIKETPEDFIVEENIDLPLKKTGEYTYFKLTKKNWNTLDALDAIAQRLNLQTKQFNYAGIKDKNAITTQYVSCYKLNPKNLERVNIPGINLEYIGRGEERLKLGQLTSNTFTITVKRLHEKKPEITFIENYFDDQRFAGTNHLIGRAFTQGKWEEATKILGIKAQGNDHMGALRQNVTKKMLLFYLNAYQSYLWNEAVRMYLSSVYKESWTSFYHGGELIFSNEKVEQKIIPLLGYLIQLRDEDIKPYYETLMHNDKIVMKDFLFTNMPELRSEGNERDMIVELKDMKIHYTRDPAKKDHYQCQLKFTLPPGSYATMVIKKMFSQK